MVNSVARTGRIRSVTKPSRGRPPKNEEDHNIDSKTREARVRLRIIRAAAEAYRQSGYHATGMADIARRVGMTASALYWYFQSKEEILFAFLEYTIQHLLRFATDSMHSEDPIDRLRELMHAFVVWQLQQREMAAAYERMYALGHLTQSLPTRERQRIKELERQFYELFRDVLQEVRGTRGIDGAKSKVMAFALIGMVEHLNSWFRSSGILSVAQIANICADIAVRMATAPDDVTGRRKRNSETDREVAVKR